MRQTCEYCCYLCTAQAIWCDKKQKEMAEISAYDLTKIYKPREKRKEENHQPTLF